MADKWYSSFLANSDQNLKVEEFEPTIYFANRERTPLQQIVRFGNIVYNGTPGECVNIKDANVREIKIDTDVHEYRARLKFPTKVHIKNDASAVVKGDGTSSHLWKGTAIPIGQYALELSTYNQGSSMTGLYDARAICQNMVLNYQENDVTLSVVDVDREHNKILVRVPNETTDGFLEGTNALPENVDIVHNKDLLVQSTSQYEAGNATDGMGLEKTAIYKNYAQFFDVMYGQSLTADAMKFHGGDPRKAMDDYYAQVLGECIERSMLWGQGMYIKDPADEANRKQQAQGIIPALLNGPNASSLVKSLGSNALTEDDLNDFLDAVNLKDSSMAPCLVSKRFLRALNKIERDKVKPTSYAYTSCGLQIQEYKSDIGVQKFIYEPFLDNQTTILNGTKVNVDCIKYNFDRWAKICKLVPLTIRPDIGKYTGSTLLKKWIFTILTYEWNHPELGGLLVKNV